MIGLDTAKSVLQIPVVDEAGMAVIGRTRAVAKDENYLDRIHNIAANHEKSYPTIWQAPHLL
jgi:hypothetical protein